MKRDTTRATRARGAPMRRWIGALILLLILFGVLCGLAYTAYLDHHSMAGNDAVLFTQIDHIIAQARRLSNDTQGARGAHGIWHNGAL